MNILAFKVGTEYVNSKSPLKALREYQANHPRYEPEKAPVELAKSDWDDHGKIAIRKYGKSSFRHKDRPSGIVKDFNMAPNGNIPEQPMPEVSHPLLSFPVLVCALFLYFLLEKFSFIITIRY